MIQEVYQQQLWSQQFKNEDDRLINKNQQTSSQSSNNIYTFNDQNTINFQNNDKFVYQTQTQSQQDQLVNANDAEQNELLMQQKYIISRYMENQIKQKFEEVQHCLLQRKNQAIQTLIEQQYQLFEALPKEILNMKVSDFLDQAGQQGEYQILDVALQRNFPFRDIQTLQNNKQQQLSQQQQVKGSQDYYNQVAQPLITESKDDGLINKQQICNVGINYKQCPISACKEGKSKKKMQKLQAQASKRKRNDLQSMDQDDNENIDPNGQLPFCYNKQNGSEHVLESSQAAQLFKSNRKIYTITKNKTPGNHQEQSSKKKWKN